MSASPTSRVTPLRPQVPCPQCNQPSQRATYPFCSKRCADLDLGAWLNGSYRISDGGNGGNNNHDGDA
ncbi:MAG: DNA gyrase inhibitor YacG [Rhizobiaceae bacterium]|nr:DNA gyrase inhibitor YacG [Hyphomicrobiales bacterium]NRB31839.1 DNA gyrase inhibitor YacG [Rhizobiaceae bacterium]